MAQTRKFNVVVIDTNGDTLAGPQNIATVRVVAGGATGTGTISAAGITIFDSGQVTSNTGSHAQECPIKVGGAETLTFALTGSGCKMYLYMDE